MKKALVVHPWFPIFGGGEYLCLCVCKTLQDAGYEVSIISDVYQPEVVEEIYGMGDILAKCRHIPLPLFQPRKIVPRYNLYAIQKLWWARQMRNALEDIEADVVFATQPSWFKFKQKKRYDFTYNIRDLFKYPSLLFKAGRISLFQREGNATGLEWKLYFFFLGKLRDILIGGSDVKRFLALSGLIYRDLIRNGLTNSEMIFPPARLDVFHPKLKKRQVVISCRIDPAKHLELFFEIARRLPSERFLLVGRDNETTRRVHPQYAERLFKKKPDNCQFVNSPLRQVPETIEESQVYLYTGIEPGIGIAIMEACGAGCIPISPNIGGASEIVTALGAGFTFSDPDDAVRKVKMALDDPPWTPEELRAKALKAFSPEVFESRLKQLIA